MKIKLNNEKIDLAGLTLNDIIRIDDNHFKCNLNGKMIDCYVASDENFIHVFVEGRTFSFEKVKEGFDFEFSPDGTQSGREEIKPPMPGSVVKLLVENGQKVNEGDGLIIVEAMKMETTIYSSISGVISEIDVEAGQQVDANKILLVVEKEN